MDIETENCCRCVVFILPPNHDKCLKFSTTYLIGYAVCLSSNGFGYVVAIWSRLYKNAYLHRDFITAFILSLFCLINTP